MLLGKNVLSIRKIIFIVVVCAYLQACSVFTQKHETVFYESVKGEWITDISSEYMLNPQTSGLTYYDGYLYSISDGSADETQIKRLHKISLNEAKVIDKLGPFKMSDNVKKTCFSSYLNSRPDYEGLVSIPNRENQWLIVTEDATRAGELSESCQMRFKETGSTEHPTLLVKIELISEQLLITGIRALQFDKTDNVGNFPNDGIEGLTITKDSRILLGLEKDNNTQARVFELAYEEQMFNKLDEFIKVKDTQLLFPIFDEGNHPINGMDVYYPADSDKGYLIAAARNDDQLWILDLDKQKPTKIVNVEFFAPSPTNGNCASYHKIKNTALEGVAVKGDDLYLINDPWKRVYADNTVCESDRQKYEDFAPLLFKMTIKPEWFN